jgi:hypothetical protein
MTKLCAIVTQLKAFQEVNIVQCCYITEFVLESIESIDEIFHLLIGSGLLQILITLFDSSMLARIYTNGFQTPLELEYKTNHGTANRLLEELNDQRKRKWEKTVESTNFIHSSRKAWSLLWKLGTESNTGVSSPTHQLTAN